MKACPESNSKKRRMPWRAAVIGVSLMNKFFTLIPRINTETRMETLLNDHFRIPSVHRSDEKPIPKNRLRSTATESLVTTTENYYPFVFAGCLLLKDDNQILPEWLAFHYTTLPLRQLIVAIDPLSNTSPEPILDEYRKLGMNITVWTGNWYYKSTPDFKLSDFDPNTTDSQSILLTHRRRQISFLSACLSEHKRQKRTWTVLVDTDEFVNFNHYNKESETRFMSQELQECRKAAGKEINASDQCYGKLAMEHGSHPRLKLPSAIGRQNETVAHLIDSGIDPYFHSSFTDKYPCVTLNRLLFGAHKSSSAVIEESVPTGIDVKAFHTLQYLKHSPNIPTYYGKSLMDASKFDDRPLVNNPHTPLVKKCIHSKVTYYNITLRVHHYTGTYETFYSRLGRNPENWDNRNKHDVAGEDTSMRHWFHDFTTLVGGIEKAKNLTQKLREQAYQESMKLLARVQRNETVRPFREWNDW